MTEYLDLPLRSLEELRDETAAVIDALALERNQILRCSGLPWVPSHKLQSSAIADARLDAISGELGPLIDRLDVLEEEIGFCGEREERRNSPITL